MTVTQYAPPRRRRIRRFLEIAGNGMDGRHVGAGRHSPYQLLVHGLKNTGGVGKPVNGPRVGQIEGVDSSTREPGSKYLAHMFCKNFELDEFKGSADTPPRR